MKNTNDVGMKDSDKKTIKTTSDFTTGLVTFAAFIVFMCLWMYFST